MAGIPQAKFKDFHWGGWGVTSHLFFPDFPHGHELSTNLERHLTLDPTKLDGLVRPAHLFGWGAKHCIAFQHFGHCCVLALVVSPRHFIQVGTFALPHYNSKVGGCS